MVYKRPPYTPAAAGFGTLAARSLAEDGFDVVRLGVIYSAVEPRPGQFDDRYIGSIASTVDQLAHQGVYTLLDFHQDQMSEQFGGEGFPAWSVQTGGLPPKPVPFPLGYTDSQALDLAYDAFWRNSSGPGGVGLQERYVEALQHVAEHFAADPWVIGYDVFNEPWPANAGTAQLDAFYARAVSALRKVDRRHLIWLEPFVLSNFGVRTELSGPKDPLLGLSFHDYCAENANQNPYACSASEETTAQNASSYASATGKALLLTEFGATDDLVDLRRVVDIADQEKAGWVEWAYCGCGDPTGTVPPSIEGLVSNPRDPATGSNVNTAKLGVLSEPYPRVVSGTPLSYSFDSGSGTFDLTYSTVAPDGRTFGPGSRTDVFAGSVQYPHGYDVRVDGGRVVSAKDAQVLEVGSDGGRRIVTVEVSPRG
jgi:endoglycosylceramidase